MSTTPKLSALTEADWGHIRETAALLAQNMDFDRDDVPEEDIMTSIGYVKVGHDPYVDECWVTAFRERVEFGPKLWSKP